MMESFSHLLSKLLEWAWALILMLFGWLWSEHAKEMREIRKSIKDLADADLSMRFHTDTKISEIGAQKLDAARYEENRKEVWELQIKIFDRMGAMERTMSRIEGRLEQ